MTKSFLLTTDFDWSHQEKIAHYNRGTGTVPESFMRQIYYIVVRSCIDPELIVTFEKISQIDRKYIFRYYSYHFDGNRTAMSREQYNEIVQWKLVILIQD